MVRASAQGKRETHVRILHARFIRNVPTITPFICLQKSNSQPFRNKTGGENIIGIYIIRWKHIPWKQVGFANHAVFCPKTRAIGPENQSFTYLTLIIIQIRLTFMQKQKNVCIFIKLVVSLFTSIETTIWDTRECRLPRLRP